MKKSLMKGRYFINQVTLHNKVTMVFINTVTNSFKKPALFLGWRQEKVFFIKKVTIVNDDDFSDKFGT